jgi:WD40 repeat protein
MPRTKFTCPSCREVLFLEDNEHTFTCPGCRKTLRRRPAQPTQQPVQPVRSEPEPTLDEDIPVVETADTPDEEIPVLSTADIVDSPPTTPARRPEPRSEPRREPARKPAGGSSVLLVIMVILVLLLGSGLGVAIFFAVTAGTQTARAEEHLAAAMAEARLAAHESLEAANLARRDLVASREQAKQEAVKAEQARKNADAAKAETEQLRKENSKARTETDLARMETVAARKEADAARKEADAARKQPPLGKSEQELRNEVQRLGTLHHASQIEVGVRAWTERDLGRAREILAAIPPALQQNWESRYLRGLCDLVAQPLTERGLRTHFGVSFSPDGKLLASADSFVRLWDTQTGREVTTLANHTLPRHGVCFTPDNKQLLVFDRQQQNFALYDIESKKVGPTTFGMNKSNISRHCVCFSPDGKFLACGNQGNVRVWEVSTGKEQFTREGWQGSVASVGFSSDGKTLVAATSYGALRVWDAQTGEEQKKTVEGDRTMLRAAAISPDGKLVAWGELDRTGRGGSLLRVVDVATGQDKYTRPAHTTAISDLAFSGDGKILVSGSRDHTFRIWNADTGQLFSRVRVSPAGTDLVSFSPVGNRVATAGVEGALILWRTPMPAQERLNINAALAGPQQVSFHPDSQSLFVVTLTGPLHVVDAQAGKDRLLVDVRGARNGTFSPDGKTLLTAGPMAQVQIWDATTGKEKLSFKGLTGFASGAWFSADGTRVLGAADQILKVWDAGTGEEVCTLKGHTTAITSACFSPDGKTVVSNSTDRMLRLWDAQTGESLRTVTLNAGTMPFVPFCFSPDGTKIVAGVGQVQGTNELKMWDSRLEKELPAIPVSTGRVSSVCFSPDGKLLLIGCLDGVVRLWDMQTRCELLALVGHGAEVVSVCFSPDGDTIASIARDNTVKLWSTKARQ